MSIIDSKKWHQQLLNAIKEIGKEIKFPGKRGYER